MPVKSFRFSFANTNSGKPVQLEVLARRAIGVEKGKKPKIIVAK
jgi:hypothetical protein